jgi:hypothetical protein
MLLGEGRNRLAEQPNLMSIIMMVIIIIIMKMLRTYRSFLGWTGRKPKSACLLVQLLSKNGFSYGTFGLGRLRSAVAADSSESSPACWAFNNNSFASRFLRTHTHTHTIQVYTPRNKSMPHSILESEDKGKETNRKQELKTERQKKWLAEQSQIKSQLLREYYNLGVTFESFSVYFINILSVSS